VGNVLGGKKRTQLFFSEVMFLGLLLLFFIWYNFIKAELNQVCFLTYGFLSSFFCGFQFPVITKIIGEIKGPAAGCLAADLAGAAVGTFLVGTILIPLLGIQSAILFLMLVKITSLAMQLVAGYRSA